MEKEYIIFCYILVGIYLYYLQKDNLNEKMLKEFSLKIYKQNETVIMMNNLQESILIKSEDKIDFMNQNFVGLFHDIID